MILIGDCVDQMRTLADNTIQTCVTSPPYWGLRDYGVNGQLGLEKTPDEYVANMVQVFREVRRVLKDDGTLFLNLGDSYSNGVTNLSDLVQAQIESHVLFFGGADPRRRSAERVHILIYDKSSPDNVFQPLFTSQSVLIKNGQDDFCQVGGPLDSPVVAWMGRSLCGRLPNYPDGDGLVDVIKHIGIIISTCDLQANTPLNRAATLTIKTGKTTLTIDIPREPKSKTLPSLIPALDTFTLYTSAKRASQINAINQAVSLLDRADVMSSSLCNFSVRQASIEKFSFDLHAGAEVCVFGVRHFYLLKEGLIPFSFLLAQAKRKNNSSVAKQEIGIPDLVKRALMEDGWICRQTIIWHKPNAMPESVRDRCTKAHEYIFLMSKSPKYYFDHEAIKEPAVCGAKGSEFHTGKTGGHQLGRAQKVRPSKPKGSFVAKGEPLPGQLPFRAIVEMRNKRSVWTVTTKPFKGAHFATFPTDLIEPCVLAGSAAGDQVLDPFAGAGTTGLVCKKHGREFIGIELNADYAAMAEKRIQSV